jgi:WD40 repeat protein
MLGGLVFRPDGRELAVAVGDLVHVYRTGTWELLHQLFFPPPTTDLAYSPDGQRLAAVNYDGIVTLADPSADQAILQLRGLAKPRIKELTSASRVAFSPDGRWLLSTNWDFSLNLWDGSPAP